jgi:hypothetical protein
VPPLRSPVQSTRNCCCQKLIDFLPCSGLHAVHDGGNHSCRPKSVLAQIFQEQRELAEKVQSTQDREEDAVDDAERTGTAATRALFAQLPFHTARCAQQRQHEGDTAEVEEEETTKIQQHVELETADSFIRKFAPATKPGVCGTLSGRCSYQDSCFQPELLSLLFDRNKFQLRYHCFEGLHQYAGV